MAAAQQQDDLQNDDADSQERFNRSASNQQKLEPLMDLISNKIVSQLSDPRDRLNFYNCCRFMNALAAPANYDDENGLYKLKLKIIYCNRRQAATMGHSRMRIKVNNRIATIHPEEVVQFLNKMRSIFGNRIGILKLKDLWTIPDDEENTSLRAEILSARTAISQYIKTHFIPQEIEFQLFNKVNPDAREALADLRFTRRLTSLAINYRELDVPYNATKFMRDILVTLNRNGVHLQKLILRDTQAVLRAIFEIIESPEMLRNQKQTSQAIIAHASTLQQLDTNWLMGFKQNSFDFLVNKLDHLQQLHLTPSSDVPLNFDMLLSERPEIAKQITELSLHLNSFQSNGLLLTLAARFPRVKKCTLLLYRQTENDEVDDAQLALQTRNNYSQIAKLVKSIFDENLNQTMVLRIHGIDIFNRKIIKILIRERNALIASFAMGTQTWLYKMEATHQMPTDNCYIQGKDNTIYHRKPKTVQILLADDEYY